MQTPEGRQNLVPGHTAEIKWVYDYERCADLQELRFVMQTINMGQYQLVSVTQDSEDIFTVFFRRCAIG